MHLSAHGRPMSAAIYLTAFQRISKKFPSMPQCQGHHNKVVAHGHVNGFVVVCEYGGRTGLIFYVKSL